MNRRIEGDTSLLEPFDRHISVKIEERNLELPANNTVLRILQFLEVDLYPSRLCWNGDCDNCRVSFINPATGSQTTAKGCQTEVVDGMNILSIPEFAEWPEDESAGS